MSEKLQIVYPYFNRETAWEELRYSLRSLEANLKEDFEAVIIGEAPSWLKEDSYILIPQIRIDRIEQTVNFNILQKLEILANHTDVNAEFVRFDDDMFLLKPTNYEWFKSNRHVILDFFSYKAQIAPHNNYALSVKNTIELCRKRHLPTWNHNLHMPRLMNKKNLYDMFLNTSVIASRFHWETLYANTYLPENFEPHYLMKEDFNKIGYYGVLDEFGTLIPEEQTYEEFKEWTDLHQMLSVDDAGFENAQHGEVNYIKKYLEEKFPTKSRFEK